MIRIAVDIGGTFTDVVLEHEDGRRISHKLLTTYDHPGNAVLEGIAQVIQQDNVNPAEVGLIIHGTTLATNALIERSGAVTALLTTEGHRDALEMAHEDRFEQYDINIDRTKPLVPRYLRLPVRERMDRDGNILVPLDPATVEAALPVLDQHEVKSVAIGYLHAYVNPAHEIRTAEILANLRPTLSISLASEVAPEIREFERLSTACANAYVRPLMASYLERLASELKHKGFNCPFLLMTSGGGLTTLETAAKFPIRLVESGPAGGAILARHIAGQLGFNRLLSFDMGGTTAKLCLIDDGKPLMSRSFEVDRAYRFKKGSGLPVRIPVIEMVEIGAGGGSIASIDKLQRVNVGPESAGSEPGPAAYDLGGDRPTVTDTDIQLGKIVTSKFAAGAISLNTAAAEKAIDEHIGHPLNLDTDLAAFSVNEVVDENMSAAARTHAAEFGLDMSQRDVIAFGGAAPLHAGRLGQKLGVNRIVIPQGAGVGSAIGFLLAPVAYEVVRSRHQQLGRLDTKIVNELFDSMHNEAISVVRQGSSQQDFIETRQAYMRYTGQGHEIAIDLPVADYTAAHSEIFQTEFEKVYSKLYGHVINGVEIEVLSWTLTITAGDQSVSNPNTSQTTTENPEPIATQLLFDPDLEIKVLAPVFMRHQLPKDWQHAGPVLITEAQTTTVVSSAWQASIDQYANIVLEKVAAR